MKKIVLADDERNIVKILESFLKLEGYTVLSAFDGASALRLIGEHKPDLAILDVMMPVMDGYSVCRALAEDPQYAPPPKVIIMTSRDQDLDKRVSLTLGADAFINKPVRPDEVVKKVKELIG